MTREERTIEILAEELGRVQAKKIEELSRVLLRFVQSVDKPDNRTGYGPEDTYGSAIQALITCGISVPGHPTRKEREERGEE